MWYNVGGILILSIPNYTCGDVMICTFFGHRDVSREIEQQLIETITDLIESKGVKKFYVGNNGGFDRLVRATLKEIKKKHPHIEYAVVLAYVPVKKDEYEDYSDTLFPSALEGVPMRARIVARNEWMINRSNFVVTHVYRTASGAAESKAKAEKKGKTVINILP